MARILRPGTVLMIPVIMKRLYILAALFCGIFTQSFAQIYDFRTFEPLMESRDTAAIRKMLESWEPRNADYYAAAFNSLILTAESYEDAMHSFEVVREGIGLYPDRLDLRFGLIHTLVMVEDFPSALSWIDDVLIQDSENGGQWLWMNDEPVDDCRNTILSGIDDYLSAILDSGDEDIVYQWLDKASEAYPFYRNGLLVIKGRMLSGQWKQEEAMAVIRSILEDDPEYYGALYDLAYLSYLRGDFDTAIEYFGKILLIEDDEDERASISRNILICEQEKADEPVLPDMAELERMVKEDRPQYDALVARFEAADSTMTDADIQMVYYGYAFTELYSPASDYKTMVNALVEQDKLDEAKKVAEGLLKKYPVSLWLLKQLYFISNDLDEDSDSYYLRYVRLTDSIVSSGNGRSTDRPIHVISTSDEYEILDFYRARSFGGQSLVEHDGSAFDRMDFINDFGDAVSLYFNVDLLFRKYNEIFQ